MTEIWFTADTHFGHKNIIAYCNRPFDTVEDMNDQLVVRWNRQVKEQDIVIHCGDVAMGLVEDAEPVVGRLRGHKLLLMGNHDTTMRLKMLRRLGWQATKQLVVNDVLVQHHYVDAAHNFEKVVHGHAHGSCTLPLHMDVGVDVWGFTLVPVLEVLSRRDEFTLRRVLRSLLGHT